ncbi:hypothetical protein TBLA_0B00150 [Henningerozyma blattae CBS 6284]|uniref:Mediator of RNA polymerase II transcription subunit 16 n=1 Tax=Henningerozyma blattae (strain ATCC 34711 / CBS 6284 / DSM 70876 / NBRC 10599 / NRRL Y-10934 / UCD 77-7) TaxID=1071380 RepID=I2GXK8_HENB6|nr:hypothetical protein TBLA_0B00150 [Tetrapisispora blattae CBS 6284]CCH58860.1 hypothetical protein TBLA_0B00150 [Tetrapisispora blattae CBS 6284]
MNILSSSSVSWSKIGLIAYADNVSTEGNLSITFLETINGLNWRFHEPQKYCIHPHLHETQFHSSSNVFVGGSHGPNSVNSGNTIPASTGQTSTPSILGSLPVSNNASKSSSHHFFYSISSVYWNNWFNLPGDMLAVCDELGNMTMLILGQSPQGPVTIDKLTMLFQDNVYKLHNQLLPLQQVNEKSDKIERKETKKEYQTTILDFSWFSSSKPIISSQFCVLDSSTDLYKNKVQQIQPYGVFYPPSMKYGCLAVRKNGQVDFWYQFSNSKNHKKITTHLLNAQNKETNELDWLQFAKITPMNEDQCILITTFSRISKRLTFYKLHVNWNINPTNPTIINNPSLRVYHLLETTVDSINEEGNPIELTDLYILSRPSSEKEPPLEVLLIFENLEDSTSIIKRYRLTKSKVSKDFLKMLNIDINNIQDQNSNTVLNHTNNTSTNNNNNMNNNYTNMLSSKRYTLTFFDKIKLEKRVVSISSKNLYEFITIYFEDGTIKTYSHNEWKLESDKLKNQNNLGKYRNILTSVISCGFQFPKTFHSSSLEWMIISPSMTGAIVKLKKRQTPNYFAIETDVSDGERDRLTATAYAFGFVSSTHRQLSSEDLSISCKTHLMKINEVNNERAHEFVTSLMTSIYSFFNMTPDAPKDILDKMISSRPVQKTILLQLELSNGLKQTNIYEMSRSIMSLRNVLFAFNGVARNLQFAIEQINSNSISHSNGKLFQAIFTKQDLIHSLIPIAKWFIKFVTYLIQGAILMINDNNSKSNTLVLGILGAKIPRTIMISILSEINKVIQLITKYPETTFPILDESSNFLRMIILESPINLEDLERLLIDVNTSLIKFTEHKPYFIKNPRLLVTSAVLEGDKDVENYLLSLVKNTFLKDDTTSNIFFSDTNGLRITNDVFFQKELLQSLQPLSKGLVVDQEILPNKFQDSKSISILTYDSISYEEFTLDEIQGKKLKRCCRCGSITRAGYTIFPSRAVIATSIQTKRWPTMYSRVCICSGYLYELDTYTPTGMTPSNAIATPLLNNTNQNSNSELDLNSGDNSNNTHLHSSTHHHHNQSHHPMEGIVSTNTNTPAPTMI